MSFGTFQALAILAMALAIAAGFWFGPIEAGYFAIAFVAISAIAFLIALPKSTPGGPSAAAPIESAVAEPWTPLIWCAIGIRVLTSLLVNLTPIATGVAPDHLGYTELSQTLAEFWRDPAISRIDPSVLPSSIYYSLNAAWWYVTGTSSDIPMSFFNAFVGTAAAWFVGKTAADLYGPAAGRRAFCLAAFFPSLVLWSSINIRDCWSWLFVAAAIYAGQRIRAKFNVRDLAIIALSGLGMTATRNYLFLIFFGAFGLSFFVVRIRKIPVALVVILLTGVFFSVVSERFALLPGVASGRSMAEIGLRDAQYYHDALAFGGSSFGTDDDISTPARALKYLPLGIARFLLSPFIWSSASWRQLMALPETWVWYFFLLGALRAMWRGFRTEPSRVALPIMVSLFFCMAYGLIEGNEGTAFRHRAQVVIVFFIFTAGDWAYRKRMAASAHEPVLSMPTTAT